MVFLGQAVLLFNFWGDRLFFVIAETKGMEDADEAPRIVPVSEQRRLLVELCRQNPSGEQMLADRLETATPIVVKGVHFDWCAVGLALCEVRGVSTELSLFSDSHHPDAAPSAPQEDSITVDIGGDHPDDESEGMPVLFEEAEVKGPPELVDALHEFSAADYYGRCEVVFNDRSNTWELVESVLNTRTVLDEGYEEWLLEAEEDDGCFLVSVGAAKPQRDIAVTDALVHLVMQRSSDGRKLVRSTINGKVSLRTVQEARAAHKNFSIEVPCTQSAAFDTLKCSGFVFPREGIANYIEIESLLKALRVKREGQTLGGYVCHQFSSWSKSLVKYGLRDHCVNSLVYDWNHDGSTDTSDRPLLRKTVSATGALVLVARWSLESRQQGGFDSPAEKANARHMLERLLMPLYNSGDMEIVLYTSGDIKCSDAGVLCGKSPVRLKVSDQGIVDTSALGAFLSANATRLNVGRWIAELAKRNFQSSAHLLELVIWLVGDAFQRSTRQDFRNQVLWNLGLSFDDFLLAKKCARLGQSDQRQADLPALTVAERTALYYHSTKETVANAGDPILFLSGSQDKSHVKNANMFSGFYSLPSNATWWGLPLDSVSSIIRSSKAQIVLLSSRVAVFICIDRECALAR